jgi:hypothetical protein
LLSTPRKSDAMAGGHGDAGRMGTVRHILHKATAELCPTPTKRDIRMDRWSPAYDKRKSPTTDALLDGAQRGLLPTPMATDGRQDGDGTGAGSTFYLQRELGALRTQTTLATPRKSDGERGGRGDVLAQMRNYPSAHSNPTPEKWAGARALAAMLANHGLVGMVALPVTYGWMLGYPPSWLTSAALLVKSSQPSATPLSRKSRKA